MEQSIPSYRICGMIVGEKSKITFYFRPPKAILTVQLKRQEGRKIMDTAINLALATLCTLVLVTPYVLYKRHQAKSLARRIWG